MSDHYKPIGGMFPGVRGSTKIGGTDESANKLVILNDEGLLDSSMFPDDIKEAGSVVEDLEEEVRNRIQGDEELASAVEAEATSRRNGDVNLDARISSVERAANARIDTVDGKVDELSATVGGSDSGIIKDIADIKSDVSSVESEVSSLETTVGDQNGGLVKEVAGLSVDLSSVESRITDAEAAIDEIESGSSGQSERIAALQSQILVLNSTVGTLQTVIGDLTEQIRTLGNSVSQQGSLVNSLNTQVHTLSTSVSDLDRRVTALEEIVEPSNL